MASEKTAVIQRIFETRWEGASRPLSNSLVTLGDLENALRARNEATRGKALSGRNVANFFKDFLRKTSSANDNWPPSVFERGFTARQRTGGNACFEFIAVKPGQTKPFPGIPVPALTADTPRYRVGSASMPLASRLLGRSDEPWLIQVLVNLRVVETHLALFSKRDIVQVDHLQMSVKLSETEVDALFLAVEEQGSDQHPLFVTLEAKGRADDILEDQILMQVRAVARTAEVTSDLVVPIAVKALAPSIVYVVEFDPIARLEAEGTETLSLASAQIYEFVPPIPGIDERSGSRRRNARVK